MYVVDRQTFGVLALFSMDCSVDFYLLMLIMKKTHIYFINRSRYVIRVYLLVLLIHYQAWQSSVYIFKVGRDSILYKTTLDAS